MEQSSQQGYSATRFLRTPYGGVTLSDYYREKRRLQLELLKIQTRVVEKGERICLIFDGRDAAGKGSTIERFVEKLMPQHLRVVRFGIPSPKESKNWLNRYKKKLPVPGEIVLFDRSWYNRALIEPTMGYCGKNQYKYFMNHVLEWEHGLMDCGLRLVKFYLSVDTETQLIRFQDRLSDPLTYWKISPNDFQARKKWAAFTKYKDQMFRRTSSPEAPWVVIRSNRKVEARLTCMLHVVRLFGNDHFEPLTGETAKQAFDIEINGIPFHNLNVPQYETLKRLLERASSHHTIDAKID